jgi:hypothetical protein
MTYLLTNFDPEKGKNHVLQGKNAGFTSRRAVFGCRKA